MPVSQISIHWSLPFTKYQIIEVPKPGHVPQYIAYDSPIGLRSTSNLQDAYLSPFVRSPADFRISWLRFAWSPGVVYGADPGSGLFRFLTLVRCVVGQTAMFLCPASVHLSSEFEGEEKWCCSNKLVHEKSLVMSPARVRVYGNLSTATFPERCYFATYRPYCLDCPSYGPRAFATLLYLYDGSQRANG
jgi:hypothetical protein